MRDQKKKSTIDIKIKENKNGKEAFYHAGNAYVALLGLGWFLYDVFSLKELHISLPLTLLWGLIACVGLSLLMESRKRRRIGTILLFIGIVLLALSCFTAGAPGKVGLFSYLNQLLKKEIAVSWQVQLLFETPEDTGFGVQLFSLFLVTLLAWMTNVMCRKGLTARLMLVVVSLLAAAACIKGWTEGGFGCPAMAAACLLLLYSQGKNNVDNPIALRHRFPGLIALIAVSGLIMAGLFYSGAAAGLPTDGWYRALLKKNHVSKYEPHENPMPEGELDQLKAFGGNGRTALQITMSNPEPMYFRGFVGEQFDGKSWCPGDGATAVSFSDLFYWLHEKDFYGQSQAGDLYARDYKGKPGSIDVINKDACAQYIYTPYSLNQTEEKIAQKRQIGDRNIESEEGLRSYHFQCTNQALKKSYVLQNKLGRLKDDAYLDAEESYRKYVYKNDLNLDKEEEALMSQLLGEKKERTVAEAQVLILNYLNENIKYSKKTLENGDEAVLPYFLKVSKSGYAPLYATAATLMMRYCGIPARYVEGYILPKEKVEMMNADEAFALTQNYAHAWCEFYLDGIGWIPFETVPKYLNPELFEPTKDMQKFGDGGTVNVDNNSNDDLQEEEEEEEEKPENIIRRIGKVMVAIPWYVYAGAAGLLLLILLIALLIRHDRTRRYLKSFDGEDRTLAIMHAVSYAAFLFSRMGIAVDATFPYAAGQSIAPAMGTETALEYQRCLALNEKARFSGREMTEEERSIARDFAYAMLETYKKSRHLPARFADKWFRCIY